MKKSTVNILVGVGAVIAVALVIGVIRKASKKVKLSIGSPAAISPYGSGATGSQMIGNLVDNNWNDLGGYMYQFPDGTQDYYLSDDTYAGSSDKGGNWVPAA